MLANNIQSIMTREVISLQTGTPLKEAITQMSSKNISCIIINQDSRPLGIITERDLLKIAAQDKDINQLKVEEAMTAPIKTVSHNMDIYQAAVYLEKHHFRRIVIVDDEGKLLGLVTQTDLKNHLGAAYYVTFKPLSSIMTTDVITAEHNENLLQLIQRMNRHNISCIVICKNLQPIGIISERDVTHLLDTPEKIHHLTAEEFVRAPLITIPCQTTIYEAAKLMKDNNIRRLVVMGSQNELIGVVSESDIVKHLEVDYLDHLRGIVERDRTYINTIKEGILECTPGEDGFITWINQAGTKVLGYSEPDKIVGRKIKELFVNPEDFTRLLTVIQEKEIANDFTTVLKKRSGKQIHIEGTFYHVKGEDGKIACLEGTLRDITDRKKMEEKLNKYSDALEKKVRERTAQIRRQNKELERMNARLHELSVQDGLTGLKNFRYFSRILEMEFKRAERYEQPLSCIILDIDDFKFINDRFGHMAGDLALKETAAILKKLVRDTDVVSRYGGDEFTVILPSTDLERARVVGNKILDYFRDFQLMKGQQVLGKISLSIGLAALPNKDIKTHQQLLEFADRAMYRAKEHGKNNVCTCLELS
ncbi:MAG: diguanylate cyclase [Candidatus Schekmanbacteria bacterium]|nr:diguanylate cyclase [Candidatus Schekmanbacteria bacterium]